jgi:RNA polymerase primary sigma factor
MKTLDIETSSKTRKSESLEFVKDSNVVSAYYREIKNIKSLSLDEEKALVVRIKQGDKKAFNALIEANLKFVVVVCRKYQNQGLPMGDLINEGNLGLIKAAHRFDASLDFKFISYAVWWIREGILRALAEQSHTLTLPTGRIVSIQAINAATHKLEQDLGRKPIVEEIAQKIGKSVEHVTDCLDSKANTVSLNKFNMENPENPDLTLESLLVDENAAETDNEARRFLLSGNLKSALRILDDRERTVLRMYYGLNGGHFYSMLDIARQLGVTRERVRQIREKALNRLRHPTRVSKLKAFYA